MKLSLIFVQREMWLLFITGFRKTLTPVDETKRIQHYISKKKGNKHPEGKYNHIISIYITQFKVYAYLLFFITGFLE